VSYFIISEFVHMLSATAVMAHSNMLHMIPSLGCPALLLNPKAAQLGSCRRNPTIQSTNSALSMSADAHGRTAKGIMPCGVA